MRVYYANEDGSLRGYFSVETADEEWSDELREAISDAMPDGVGHVSEERYLALEAENEKRFEEDLQARTTARQEALEKEAEELTSELSKTVGADLAARLVAMASRRN